MAPARSACRVRSIASAVECIRAGARAYILKPAAPDAREVALERAMTARAFRRVWRRPALLVPPREVFPLGLAIVTVSGLVLGTLSRGGV